MPGDGTTTVAADPEIPSFQVTLAQKGKSKGALAKTLASLEKAGGEGCTSRD
jgi:hypothetical protein